jgi:flagellar basal-body rod modification protein FlgD
MVDAVNSTSSNTANSVLTNLGLTAQPAPATQQLGQQDFLNLMITQLKNQDPFKPLDSGQFLGQLAQFGTVSGLASLQQSFNSLASSLTSNQALQAAGLVGRSALAAASSMTVGAGQSVDGAVDLPSATGGVLIQVSDAYGQPVRTIQLGAQPSGLASFSWDGKDGSGAPVPAGTYSFQAAFEAGTTSQAANTLLTAPVDSVLLDSSGFQVQLRGIGELPFSSVREIRESNTPN